MTGAGRPEPWVELPPLAGPLDTLWDLVLDLAEQLPPTGWVLVGGQMVMLHGLLAGRVATRASQDVDVLADPLAERDRFAGSDRKRLQRLDEVLGDPAAAE
ncbi:hypothetical protein [Blastococcus sp. SYSU DS0541]